MSDGVTAPESVEQLTELIAGEGCVLAVGNQTKPPLSSAVDATLVSLRQISGMVEYEPSEFTFTAHAGTRLSEIEAALRERKQYLPFDPMLVAEGATLGGTVAAGLSGPGRFRYGGVRDFLLGVRFISGDGQLINAGGKVVKNAAGFDIPKFLVGSMGRLGVMTELTFKVFPKAPAAFTYRVACESHQQALLRMAEAAKSRWELDAIDYEPKNTTMVIRIAGPEEACKAIEREMQSNYGDDFSGQAADDYWRAIGELNWAPDHHLAVKIPTDPKQLERLCDEFAGETSIDLHASVAGAVVWCLLKGDAEPHRLDEALHSLGAAGLVVRGSCETPYLGHWESSEMASKLKTAMDPPGKFP